MPNTNDVVQWKKPTNTGSKSLFEKGPKSADKNETFLSNRQSELANQSEIAETRDIDQNVRCH